MTVELTNRSREPFVATLYHTIYCAKAGACKCAKVSLPRSIRLPNGALGMTVEERFIPQSISIAPKETKSGLNDAILLIPQIAEALKAQPPILRQVLIATPPETPTDFMETEARSSKSTHKGSSKPKVRS